MFKNLVIAALVAFCAWNQIQLIALNSQVQQIDTFARWTANQSVKWDEKLVESDADLDSRISHLEALK